MTTLLLTLHIIFNFALLYTLYKSFKLIKFKLTIHNVPYFILGTLMLVLLIITSFYNPIGYFTMGCIFSLIYFLIESFDFEKSKNFPFHVRIIAHLILGAAWIQFLIFVIFYAYNADKLDEKLKH